MSMEPEFYEATCISILVFKSRSRHFRCRLRIRRVGQEEYTTERLLAEWRVRRRDHWRAQRKWKHFLANAFLTVARGFSIFNLCASMRLTIPPILDAESLTLSAQLANYASQAMPRGESLGASTEWAWLWQWITRTMLLMTCGLNERWLINSQKQPKKKTVTRYIAFSLLHVGKNEFYMDFVKEVKIFEGNIFHIKLHYLQPSMYVLDIIAKNNNI